MLQKDAIHIWQATLSDFFPKIGEWKSLLSEDEMQRAMRFKFEIHRQRYIVTRAILRQILSSYTQLSAEKIRFIYGEKGKPFLAENPLKLQFNVSHSDDIAVFALTLESEIGVDVEKIEPEFKKDVAKRFFSVAEYEHLLQLPEDQRAAGFYTTWAKKEALIKALGEGLYAPLDKFSVSTEEDVEVVMLQHAGEEHFYHVTSIAIHQDYKAAIATLNPVINIKMLIWAASP